MLRRMLLWLSRSERLKHLAAESPLARRIARRFSAGETLEDAQAALERLERQGLTGTVSYLGEHVDAEAGALAATDRYLESLAGIRRAGLQANISVKLTQLGLDLDEQDMVSHCHRILGAARDAGSFVWVDMEGSAYTERTVAAVLTLSREAYPAGAMLQA
jgi:proline dehydrogenase